MNYLKFEEITHLRGVSRIKAKLDVELAHEVFGDESLAFKIFVYRYFASRPVKRSELAEVFDVKVEAIRWAEGKLARAAFFFGIQRPSEREKACLYRRSVKSSRPNPKESRKKLTLKTRYRR